MSGRTTPNWTGEEEDSLIRLIDAGRGYREIAGRLGRSETGVKIKAKRLRHRVTKTKATMSARDAACLLGLGCSKTVALWIRRFGLPAHNAGTARRPLWRLRYEVLCEWLEEIDHWMMYDPARIIDPWLREHLTRLRPAQPYWLTPGEVAERLHTLHTVVNTWIANGDLPATRYCNWWICAADLRDFVPPGERPRQQALHDPERLAVPVVAPRRVFPSVRAFAEEMGATVQQVRRYLVRRSDVYTLRPLTSRDLQRWHRREGFEPSVLLR